MINVPMIILYGVITAVIAYLFGSISFAVIFTKMSSKKDIRDMGSGNAGFTNVLRSVGVVPAVFTLVFDFLKGVIAGFVGRIFFSTLPVPEELSAEIAIYGGLIGGLFAIIGHMYPVYFGFKGGKGIATAAAMMAATDWRVFLMIVATFLIIFFASKIISLASISCAALYGVYTFICTFFFDYRGDGAYSLRYVVICTVFAFLLGTFVIVKHKENIQRLLKGAEKKLTVKKKQSA